ncbi:MAG: hypothetical protein HY506_02735 [Candidatus Yanofskybacteria bacterium]|nr:hypothetical protein [Candidatus Yanofskybacteria bacterium]
MSLVNIIQAAALLFWYGWLMLALISGGIAILKKSRRVGWFGFYCFIIWAMATALVFFYFTPRTLSSPTL